MECKFCKSTEITYNQLVMDSHCANCGEWQEGEYIK
jgi:ribosomal protein S27E